MIRKFALIFVILAFLYFLERFVFPHLIPVFVQKILPNLSLIFFCLVVPHYGKSSAQILGFLFGIMQDLLTYSPIGFHALIFLILGLFFGKMTNYIHFAGIRITTFITIVAVCLYRILAIIISYMFGLNIYSPLFSTAFLFSLISNSITSIPLFYLSKYIALKLNLISSWKT